MLQYLRFPPIFWFLILFQGANTVWCFWRYAHNGKGLTLASGVFALLCWVWIVYMGRQAQASEDRIAELNVKIAELEQEWARRRAR